MPKRVSKDGSLPQRGDEQWRVAGQGLVAPGMPESSCLPENSPGNITGLCPGETGENSEFLRGKQQQFRDFFSFLNSSAGRSQGVCPGVFRPSGGSASCKIWSWSSSTEEESCDYEKPVRTGARREKLM